MACIYELKYSDETIGKAIESLEGGILSVDDKIKFYEFIHTDTFLNSKHNLRKDGTKILDKNEEGVLFRVNENTNSLSLGRVFRDAKHAYERTVRDDLSKQHAIALRGFPSAAAKSEAIDHSADIVITAWHNILERTGKSKPADIAKEAAKLIRGNYRENVFIAHLREEKEQGNKRAEDVLNNYFSTVSKIKEQEAALKTIKEEYNAISKQHKELVAAKNAAKNNKELYDNIVAKLEAVIKEAGDIKIKYQNASTALKNAKQEQANSIVNLVNDESLNFTTPQKNYANLVNQVTYNTTNWFADVFNVAKLSPYSSSFDSSLSEDKLDKAGEIKSDEEVEISEERESIDDFSKHWDDSLPKDFTSGVSASVAQRLSRLYHLAEPVGEEGKYVYSLTRHLGTPYTMDVKRVMATIYNYGNFSSTNDLINSLEHISRVQPEMYGLSKLVYDMKRNPVLANEIWHSFAKPKIKKAMVEATAQGVEFTQSNKSIEVLTSQIFKTTNELKSTYRGAYNEAHAKELTRILTTLRTTPNVILNPELKESYTNTLYNILKQYVPSISKQDVVSYLEGRGLSKKQIEGKSKKDINLEQYTKLINSVGAIVSGVSKAIDSYNDKWIKYEQGYTDEQGNHVKGSIEYSREMSELRKQAAALTESEYNKALKRLGQAPKFDASAVNFNTLESAAINFAKEISTVIIVRNELNSMNAEGNMASNVINNSAISNLLKQIRYATEEDDNAGLNKLKEFVTASDQYKHSPIFFGVYDENGRMIKPGLFVRDATGEVTVHPRAKEMIDVSLFDGIKDRVGDNSSMYADLSAEDYFITQLLARRDALTSPTESKDARQGGYFLRTPSDASKNFIFRTDSYISGGTFKYNSDEEKAVLDEYAGKIKGEAVVGTNYEGDIASHDDNVKQAILKLSNNRNKGNIIYKDFHEFASVLNGETGIIKSFSNYTQFVSKNEDGSINGMIPIVYQGRNKNNKPSYVIAYAEVKQHGDKSNNEFQVLKIYHIHTSNTSIEELVSDNAGKVLDDAIISGKLKATTNTSSTTYHAYRQQLLGELNTFIENLNNILVNVNGEFVTKDNVDNLIERYLFDKKIVKDGKLTGNVFSFTRLFELGNYKVDELMKSGLALYGEGRDALLIENENGGLTLNLDRKDIIEVDDNGKISLNLDKDNNQLINNLVNGWMTAYQREVISDTLEFRELYTNLGFNIETVVDTFIDASLQLMAYDDLFEGDSKFYKNALDLLKRAKETQAGGKAYGNMSLDDKLGGGLVTRTDHEGNTMTITIGKGTEHQVSIPVRNGFRAVTVENTSKASDIWDSIYQEVYDIVYKQMQDASDGKMDNSDTFRRVADKIANNIAEGYHATTKVNDAQSYITLDEFVARKHADGTIEEYRDLLEKLYDPNVKLEDIDIEEVNAKIQAQKNFYFDKQFDPQTGIYYPRQIKNAEYVLIPKIVEGTSLGTLYDIMKKHDIGQLNTRETSKAANKNVLEYWDKETGVAKPETFEELVAQNIGVENYYYRYLYKQQDVVDHLVDKENKAGVQVTKKIIDNAAPHLEPYVKQFYDNFVANIRDSYSLLLNRLGWDVRKDGTLIQRDTQDDILNFDDFYRRARNEARRLGLDSNFIDYLTPELGDPKMPNYMNNVSTKLESIAQSIFNSAVTRQKLPGWHAVQIAPIGAQELVKDSEGNSRKLRYHPKVENKKGEVIQEAYAEVLVPRWSKLIPKDYSVKELAEQGLDIQIGYRIPTEGKQSVSVIKVVGFLDDIEGSKVVVPEEWVTQTGSDFDVDTMYVISPEIVVDRNGTLHKVKFDDSTEEPDAQRRYVKYVTERLKHLEADSSEIAENTRALKAATSREKLDVIKKANEEFFTDNLNKQKELFAQLDNNAKENAKRIYLAYKGKENFIKRHTEVANYFRQAASLLTSEEELPRKELYEQFAAINDALADQTDLNSKAYDHIATLKEDVAKARRDYFDQVEKIAVENHLVSFEDFKALSIEEQNSTKARNNQILDAMVAIMSDPSSREENYSRSNFDDLVEGMKAANIARTGDPRGNKGVPSAYSPMNQIRFMENAMGGAVLKAFSVTRDNFVSVSNRAQTVIHGVDVVVEYNLDEQKDGVTVYDENIIRASYPGAIKNGRTMTVTHNQLGWSKNNRNVVGKILTSYSSQTTAHILDAVKEGSIFNENKFTFGSFKTLVDLGIDYGTAVAFLMNPVITTISKHNDKRNSVYKNEYTNPIKDTIVELAERILGVSRIDRTKSIDDIVHDVLEIEKNQPTLARFGLELNKNGSLNHTIKLNRNTLIERLTAQKRGVPSSDFLLEDFATALHFHKLHTLTMNIERVARVMNSDKYGAKQSVNATREKINELIELSHIEDEQLHEKSNRKDAKTIYFTSNRTEKGLVNSVFPGEEIVVDENNTEDVVVGDNIIKKVVIPKRNGFIIDEKTSVYPHLAAFYKYATATSVKANSQLFRLQSTHIVDMFDAIFSDMKVKPNEEKYREIERSYVSYVYQQAAYISRPITINSSGQVILDKVREDNNNGSTSDNAERDRIIGYNNANTYHRDGIDIHKPTKEDIAWFNTLTPAQKVMWVKTNFKDGAGIFDFLDVNLFNAFEYKKNGYSKHSIKFNDQVADVETAYVAFRESFYSKNDLVRLAAIDLVKYAFVAEGFRFKKGGISKIITNDALYGEENQLGMNLIAQFNTLFDRAYSKDFGDAFVRSHTEYIRPIKISKSNKNDLGNAWRAMKKAKPSVDGSYVISNSIIKERIGDNHYITISENNKVTTYKVRKLSHTTDLYITPINKLEADEFGTLSSNNENNEHYSDEYYDLMHEKRNNERVIEVNVLVASEKKKQEARDRNKEIDAIVESNIAYFKPVPTNLDIIIESVVNPHYLSDIASSGGRSADVVQKFIDDIVNTYDAQERPNHMTLMNNTIGIASIIPFKGVAIQKLNTGDGVVKFAISRARVNDNVRTIIQDVIEGAEMPGHILSRMSDKAVKMIVTAVEAKMANPTFYDVKIVREETNANQAVGEEEHMSAVTPLIEDYNNLSNDYGLATLARSMATDITRDAIIRGERIAKDFTESERIRGVDFSNVNDVNNNMESVLSAEAEYLMREAKRINETLDKFILEGEFLPEDAEVEFVHDEFGNERRAIYYLPVDDPRLYTYLQKNPQEFDRLASLLLHARKLVSTQEAMLLYDVTGETESIQSSINIIRRSVNSLRNNNRLNTAFGMLFNNYIASMYSTNPMVRHAIVDLRTHFGDINWFDFTFSDIHELNHKQVQAVVKAVNQIIDHARMHVIPQAVDDFEERWADIEKRHGKIDLNRIIDDHGKVIQEYTQDFIEDGKRYREDVEKAKEEHGVDSYEYHMAKLEYDEWKAVYTHQPAAKNYYLTDTKLRRDILKTAGSTYVEYMALTRELYSDKRPDTSLSPEERKERKAIRTKIFNLLNPIVQDTSFANDAEVEKKFTHARRLKEYIKRKNSNNAEYFYYKESDGFVETLEGYIKVIEDYDKKHPYEDFGTKLANEAYREAYEWIEYNTIRTQDKKSLEKIRSAFDILANRSNTTNKSLSRLANERDAYDSNGVIDGRKFTEDDIEEIRKKTINEQFVALGGHYTDNTLIKDVERDDRVYTNEFYTLIKGTANENGKEWDKDNRETRMQMINKINELIRKGMRNHSGEGAISARALHENLSQNELNELANLYFNLADLQSERPKGNGKHKGLIEFKTNTIGFQKQMAYISSLEKDDPVKQLLLDIFTDTYNNKEGKTRKANPFIYDYVVGADKFIDPKKTAAKAFITHGTETVTTKYYTMAMEQAEKEGRYDEWYAQNHLYNQLTGRVEPLRIWTTLQAKTYTDPVHGEIDGNFYYTPTFENSERNLYEEKRDPLYDKIGKNYDNESPSIARERGLKDYDANKGFNAGEVEMANLIRNTLTMYAGTYAAQKFISEGYMPRQAKVDTNTKWWTHQILGSVGLTLRDTSRDTWDHDISYENDRDVEFDMVNLLKNKDSREYIKYLDRNKFDSDAEYDIHRKQVDEENAKIKAENEAIDANLLNRNWKSVMIDYIKGAIDVNSRNKAKTLVYLLKEDLENNPAYRQSTYSNKLVRNGKLSSSDHTVYQTTEQRRALEMVNTWANRIIHGNFKQQHKLTRYADMMQGLTSAKYMIFNVTGGIANVGTGMANIMGEVFAGEYFGVKEFAIGQKEYGSSLLTIIADTYAEKGSNKTSSLLKYFDIVDYDGILERGTQDNISEYVQRLRNATYGFQTTGEHYMQNSALISMLHSHRVYQNEDGFTVTGTIDNYTRDLEIQVLKGLMSDNQELTDKFAKYYANIKQDLQVTREYDRFNKSIVSDFFKEVGDEKLIKEFATLKKEAKKQAAKEFQALPKLYDELVYDSEKKTISIKEGSILTEAAIEQFKSKAFRINNRIHGVYNKIGAAKIEQYWWGSLVMQYHKHLYPGFMKRFRTRGFYNEARETVEKGSYLTFMNYIFGEFNGIGKRLKENSDEEAVMGSIKTILKAAGQTFTKLGTRWNLLEDWEKRNIRRVLGDVFGMASAYIMALAIYAIFDDDDVKKSDALGTLVYSADRIFAESFMWNPVGLVNEGKTLWSSPIAATNSYNDLFTAMGLGIKYFVDDDFKLTYTTGLYKGQNKFGVVLSRNIPGYRVYKRLSNMSRNNQYYRINDNSLNMKYAKKHAHIIAPDR